MSTAHEKIVRSLIRALEVAEERAVLVGDALIAHGGMDQNRGQFQSLVSDVLSKARASLSTSDIPAEN